MNTYYFNNSARVYHNKLVVIGETAFRKIMDNYLCDTPNGAWNHHWMSFEAKDLKSAKEYIKAKWFN